MNLKSFEWSLSDLPSILWLAFRVTIMACPLKFGVTPRCLKWLPGDEYDRESRPPDGNFTANFLPPPSDGYTGKSESLVYLVPTSLLYFFCKRPKRPLVVDIRESIMNTITPWLFEKIYIVYCILGQQKLFDEKPERKFLITLSLYGIVSNHKILLCSVMKARYLFGNFTPVSQLSRSDGLASENRRHRLRSWRIHIWCDIWKCFLLL